MNNPELSHMSWVSIETHRVKRPQVLWVNADAASITSTAFDAEDLYCCPVAGESLDTYASGTRTEWVDRYGGSGIGSSGGSGRCAAIDGVQCKGVGVTSLVASNANVFHSSGTLGLAEAASELLYSEVYRHCLPFGAVPVLALAVIGTRCAPRHADEPSPPPLRSLLYRPFVPRPAHFMRNLHHADALRPSADPFRGWTRDAVRTRSAMSTLAAHLHAELQLTSHPRDEIACLNAGLLELARRFAWQAAAAFAKRMPHGSISPSNLSLSGAYLDCGLTSFIPSYLRHGWMSWYDPWEELNAALPVLVTLRQQLAKYHPDCDGSHVVGAEDLAAAYQQEVNARLRIEFARMAGLTEDLAAACTLSLLDSWTGVMLEIAMRGAGDRHVPFTGCMADGGKTPAGTRRSYQLNVALSSLWSADSLEKQDAALAPVVPDLVLRNRLLRGADGIRAALSGGDSVFSNAVTRYLARQAARKNSSLENLHRETFARQCRLELDDGYDLKHKLQSLLQRHVAEARYVLDDLDPDLPGITGRKQIASLAEDLL
jgi:hypothetical protein